MMRNKLLILLTVAGLATSQIAVAEGDEDKELKGGGIKGTFITDSSKGLFDMSPVTSYTIQPSEWCNDAYSQDSMRKWKKEWDQKYKGKIVPECANFYIEWKRSMACSGKEASAGDWQPNTTWQGIGEDLADLGDVNNFLAGKKCANCKLKLGGFQCFNLAGADFSGSNLAGMDFQYANLAGANFSKGTLDSSVLLAANLRDANFQGTTLTNTVLMGANLTQANFKGAVLEKIDFRNATLDGANFEGATLTLTPDNVKVLQAARGVNLNGANFK